MENIEVKTSGIKCDNVKCNWNDSTVEFNDLKDWINKRCPDCGENLLTLEDFNNAQTLMQAVTIINSLKPDELKELNKLCKDVALKDNDMFKDAEGIENLEGKGLVNFTVSTHKDIKVTKIEKQNEA